MANPSLAYQPYADVPNDNLPTVDEASTATPDLSLPELEPATPNNQKIDLSWETDGLSPGQMFDYMRSKQDCTCEICPACLEWIESKAKNKARCATWAHDIAFDVEELAMESNRTIRSFLDHGELDMDRYADDDSDDDQEVEEELWEDREDFNRQRDHPLKVTGYWLYDSQGMIIDNIRIGEYQDRFILSQCDGQIYLRPDTTIIDYLRHRLDRDNTAYVEPICEKINKNTMRRMWKDDGKFSVFPEEEESDTKLMDYRLVDKSNNLLDTIEVRGRYIHSKSHGTVYMQQGQSAIDLILEMCSPHQVMQMRAMPGQKCVVLKVRLRKWDAC